MEGGVRSEGVPAGVGWKSDVGLLSGRAMWNKSRIQDRSVSGDLARGRIKESPFVTVCDGLDQAFKGIWWMPWH